MKKYMVYVATILSMAAILMTNPSMPVLAQDNSLHITTNLRGFVVEDGCCPNSEIHASGDVVKQADGTIYLSLTRGNIVIGKDTYSIVFTPTGKTGINHDSYSCYLGTNYDQPGTIEVRTASGTSLSGIASYSWGVSSGCNEPNNEYTYFSGKFIDANGQTVEFFTGNNSVPTFQ